VKALIEALKIDLKNENKKTGPVNDKLTKNIDKTREIKKALAKICHD
jgi:hypothetical protein